jgi:hypothetical protein
VASSDALRDTSTEPCLRCGSTDPVKVGETVEELFVYTARMTKTETRVDVDVPREMSGRLCRVCTPIVVRVIKRGQ